MNVSVHLQYNSILLLDEHNDHQTVGDLPLHSQSILLSSTDDWFTDKPPIIILLPMCLNTDFCIWGPPDVDTLIQDEEAKTVAWGTKPGHGTRVMPAGTLTGVQVLKAPAYILFSGVINQINTNINSTDTGGELDPRGDDNVSAFYCCQNVELVGISNVADADNTVQRGNPLGGLVYTNGFPSNKGNNDSYTQVIEWHKWGFP